MSEEVSVQDMDKAAASLDVLANAVVAREETLKRENEAQVELLKEVQDKIGPLLLRFKRRIEEVAPKLVSSAPVKRPGDTLSIGGYPYHAGIHFGCQCYFNGCSYGIHLGWDGRLAAGEKHLSFGPSVSDIDVTTPGVLGVAPSDTKAFIRSVLGSIEQLRRDAVDVLSQSETNRIACLAVAAEIRRMGVSSMLGSASGGW